MKDIHEVLRRKQARYAQLSKQIEALQQQDSWLQKRTAKEGREAFEKVMDAQTYKSWTRRGVKE